MQCQGSFLALALASPPSAISPALSFQYAADTFPSAHVNPEYPYRISEASDSFAKIFGFKPVELKGGSLRLVFGPETDVEKLHDIMCDKGRDDNDRVVLYQKDGNEVACSVHSTTSYSPTGERMASISILNYKSAENAPYLVFRQSSASHDGGVCANGSSAESTPSYGCVPPLTHDPKLLIHLSAIRRSRGSAHHHVRF
jgi:PAS domain S-box-containing protein